MCVLVFYTFASNQCNVILNISKAQLLLVLVMLFSARAQRVIYSLLLSAQRVLQLDTEK